MEYGNYIINDEIIFKVNEGILLRLSGEGDCVILNSPTARCLQLLLESKGEIISRDVFLDIVWRKRGIVVSQNTFYQNISLLRKSLKAAGLTKEIIKTERRKGFSLAAETSVSLIVDDASINLKSNLNIDLKNLTDASIQNCEGTINTTGSNKKNQWFFVLKIPFSGVLLIALLIVIEVIILSRRLLEFVR